MFRQRLPVPKGLVALRRGTNGTTALWSEPPVVGEKAATLKR